MEISITKLDHLAVYCASPSKDVIDDVLIMGNAFGVMRYQEPLAKALATCGLRCWWFPFSGQNGTAGTYSLRSCVQDITAVSDHIRQISPRGTLSFIAHCASTISAVEYLRSAPDNPITAMILYGFLASPERRRASAVPKLLAHGVALDVDPKVWNYRWLENLPQLEIPLLFCHGRDTVNVARATPQELAAATSAARNAVLQWFDEGYDFRLRNLPPFVSAYATWLLEKAGCVEGVGR